MAILIEGMEMPDTCTRCDYIGLNVAIGCKVVTGTNGRADNCPLIEVPPHGRLIDAEEISNHKYATIPPYRKEYSDGKPKSEDEIIAFKFGWNDAIAAIVENAPTIIPASEEG